MSNQQNQQREIRHTPDDQGRLPRIVQQCCRCGHVWIPRGWVATYCPNCLAIGTHLWIENELEGQRMSDTDVARHSTKGLPRAISVGGKVIEFSSKPGEPIIDVSKLPKIDAVCLQLATINRFNGATIRAYNVAQHSCMVGSLVASRNPELELPALLHDMPEIIYGDIVTGVKHSIGMVLTRFTDQIDVLVMNHYLGRFGFKYPLPPLQHAVIKEADTFALLLEAQTLMPPGSKPSDNPSFWPEQPQSILESPQDFKKLADTLVPMSRETACANLLNRIKSAVAKLKKVT